MEFVSLLAEELFRILDAAFIKFGLVNTNNHCCDLRRGIWLDCRGVEKE